MNNLYENLEKAAKSLFENERNFLANCSNFCALIFNNIKSLNWVGFYFLSEGELILGPFQGKPACIRIKIGNGVCGTSAQNRETIVVPNVHEFSGHIACDSASNSEIVIPLIKKGMLYGVFDIDSPAFDRFTSEDKKGLENLVELLLERTDIEDLQKIYS
jgi:GAF domain-containing protein